MGATLRYAKVVDRDHLRAHGGLSPRTKNIVLLAAPPPAAGRDVMLLRAWDDVSAGFEEEWRIEDRLGHAIHTGTPRTVLAEHRRGLGDGDHALGTFAHDGAEHAELDLDTTRAALSDTRRGRLRPQWGLMTAPGVSGSLV